MNIKNVSIGIDPYPYWDVRVVDLWMASLRTPLLISAFFVGEFLPPRDWRFKKNRDLK